MSVTQFPGSTPPSGTDLVQPVVNTVLVGLLERMLERARTGDIQTFIGIGSTSKGGVFKLLSIRDGDNYFVIRGMLDWLKDEVLEHVEESRG